MSQIHCLLVLTVDYRHLDCCIRLSSYFLVGKEHCMVKEIKYELAHCYWGNYTGQCYRHLTDGTIQCMDSLSNMNSWCKSKLTYNYWLKIFSCHALLRLNRNDHESHYCTVHSNLVKGTQNHDRKRADLLFCLGCLFPFSCILKGAKALWFFKFSFNLKLKKYIISRHCLSAYVRLLWYIHIML